MKMAELQATVEHYLPQFVKAVKGAMTGKAKKHDLVVLHQDAFAAEYHDDECLLLGLAIKYAGMVGVTIHVVGRNGETLPVKGQPVKDQSVKAQPDQAYREGK